MGEEKEGKKKGFMEDFDGDDKEDVEQLEKILTVVSEKVPALLNQLADVLYGKDRAQQYGKAVAAFYKELRDAGMSDDKAYELTQEYMSAMSIGKLMGGKGFAGMGNHDGPINGEELAKEINEKVQKKIQDKINKKTKEKEEKQE